MKYDALPDPIFDSRHQPEFDRVNLAMAEIKWRDPAPEKFENYGKSPGHSALDELQGVLVKLQESQDWLPRHSSTRIVRRMRFTWWDDLMAWVEGMRRN